MSPNQESIYSEENRYYLISNDNYYIRINPDLFLGWKLFDKTSKDIKLNLSFHVINNSYNILSSLKILNILPTEFPILFEEFFYFCECLGIPDVEREYFTNKILDHYKKGWCKFIKNNIFNRISQNNTQFYSYNILWAKICDHLDNFKDTKRRNLVLSNLSVFTLGILLGYFTSVYAFIC
jgi:hypothetical protein